MVALTVAVMLSGVLQHSMPEGEIVSQAPPVPVAADALKVKLLPVLETATICGDGFEPPSVMLKLRGLACV